MSLFDIPEPISAFRGEHAFLSNFWPASVWLEGDVYSTVEHAYQAAKSLSAIERNKVRLAKEPNEAKILGGKITLRSDWEQVKFEVMFMLLVQKFNQPEFKELLLSTGKRELIEGNYWHDNIWGECSCPKHKGKGQNHLGKLLMQIREDLCN